MLTIQVVIVSFNRPKALKNCLLSLSVLNEPTDCDLEFLVIDNHPSRNAEPIVGELRNRFKSLHYRFLGASNIADARNSALRDCTRDFLCFIDDDEYATLDWLSHLLSCQINFKANAVIGYCEPIYDASIRFAQTGHYHEVPNPPTGSVSGFYSSTANCLISMAFCRTHQLRFKSELGCSGGEDSQFFLEMRTLGGRVVWCREAVVCAPVDPRRSNLIWVIRRFFRAGATSMISTEFCRPGHGKALLTEMARDVRKNAKSILLSIPKGRVRFLDLVILLKCAARWLGALVYRRTGLVLLEYSGGTQFEFIKLKTTGQGQP